MRQIDYACGYLIVVLKVIQLKNLDCNRVKTEPDALTYLASLNYGESITVAGIAFGVLSVAPEFYQQRTFGAPKMNFLP